VVKYLADFTRQQLCDSTATSAAFNPAPNRLRQLSIVPYPHSEDLSSTSSRSPFWGSTQHFALPTPGRGEFYSPFMATNFVQGGAICPPAAQAYVLPSRTGDVLHSAGTVADSLPWSWVSSVGSRYAGVQVSVSL
jgi:hypothetical protein